MHRKKPAFLIRLIKLKKKTKKKYLITSIHHKETASSVKRKRARASLHQISRSKDHLAMRSASLKVRAKVQPLCSRTYSQKRTRNRKKGPRENIARKTRTRFKPKWRSKWKMPSALRVNMRSESAIPRFISRSSHMNVRATICNE